ncbi:MAG: DEAD/DEAH box helicase family protein [Candidatus Bipolaricaulia bacterium]
MLSFERGTILCRELDPDAMESTECPHLHLLWDPRVEAYRAPASSYREIVESLHRSKVEYKDQVLDLVPCPAPLHLTQALGLRDYQEEALEKWWLAGKKRGVVVLPTGAGKTYVALAAIDKLNRDRISKPSPTFIIVPTLDLVDQWISELRGSFNVEIGEYTGRSKVLKPITVATYDSAYIHAEHLGNRFKFLIVDEVHHLPAENYRQIAQAFAAPYRLGLTATYEREDELHKALPELLGGKIFEVGVKELAGKHLAEYRVETFKLPLAAEERAAYTEQSKVFADYIRSSRIRMTGPQDFQKIILRSGSDPRAWKAVRAQSEARKIAYNSQTKLEKLRELLEEHRGDRLIIFTRYNDLVYRISQRFLIPAITYRTGKEERRQVLQGFKDGTYQAIVSSQVLDEGVDVPEANVGIILSGTGSSREFIQRLGRILRPAPGKRAILYELVSAETGEVRTASKRKNRDAT